MLCKTACAKQIVIRWAVTQSLSIEQQLETGVRYLDMRTGYLKQTDEFHVVHGLYGHNMEILLSDVANFLRKHPKEVIVLDFHEFFSFTKPLHQKFAKFIESHFASMLYAPSDKGLNVSLKDIWAVGGQAIVIYDDTSVHEEFPNFWSKNHIYSPWPNTNSVSTLLQALESRFDSLKPLQFNVFQAILSPQTSDIVKHLSSSLRKFLSVKCDVAVSKWLAKVYDEKKKGANIVICDFVDMDKCVESIIKLNDLLRY